jgi:MATE family multidrug resistance protein
MEDAERSLREPLIDSEVEPGAKQRHTFTFANGVTRSVSRRDEEISCTQEWIWGEVQKQMYIAGPMVCVALLQYLLIVVSVMFVGHLGELELASASIASSFAGVTGTSAIIGMASALDTLCGQAFGAKQYHMLGIYMQRAIFVLYLVCIPISLVWWNMDALLVSLGQNPEISALAGLYARYLVPTVFAVATVQPLLKFLQAQSIVLPMALFSAITLLLHIPLCWLLIFKLGVGYRGAAIATSASSWLNVIFLALYVKYSSSCKRTWTAFSREAFNDLPAFFKLALPSTIMICLEYWSFEGLVLLSGLLANPQLETSTLSICLTTLALLYMIPYGVGAAVSTRVGNELGAGRPQAAKGAVMVAVSIGVLEGWLIATLLFSSRHVWGKAYSNEREVIDYVARCVPLLTVVHVMDSIQGVLSGVARGCGWQAFGAAANLGAYYIVGLPAAVVLAFLYDLKGRGLWLGMIMGIVTQTTTLLIMTGITDWHQQAERALLRVYSSATATLPMDGNHAQKDEIPALHFLKDCKEGDEEEPIHRS